MLNEQTYKLHFIPLRMYFECTFFMYIVLSTLLNIRNREIPFTFILVVVLYFGMEVLSSLKDTQISHFAHLFGGAMGAFWGFYRR